MNYLKTVEQLLENINVKKEGKGMLSNSFLRKMLELSRKSTLKEEFLLRIGYTVARNTTGRDSDLEKFFFKFKRKIKKIENMKEISKLIEYLVMKYTVSSKLDKDAVR